MSSHTSQLYTRIRETAVRFAHSYDEDKISKDITALSATLSPDCIRYYAPASMLEQLPSLKAGETNQAYEAHMGVELKIWSTWRIDIEDLVVDEHQHKAVLRTIHTCTSQRGKVYDFEFVFTLSFTETGERVIKIVQFVDTGVVTRLLEDEKAFAEELEPREEVGGSCCT